MSKLRCTVDICQFRPFLYWAKRHRPNAAGLQSSPAQTWGYIIWIQEAGTGTLRTADEELTLRPGQAAICNPGCELRWQQPASFVRVAFDLVDRPRVPDGSPVRWRPEPPTPQPRLSDVLGLPMPTRVPDRHVPHLCLLAENCIMNWWRAPGHHARCALDLGRWVLDLAESLGASCFSNSARLDTIPLAEQADILIERQYHSGWGVATLAGLLGVSREHLSRTYQRDRGISIQSALTRRRLTAALVAIEQTDAGLDTIAREHGFGSTDTMCRQCLLHTGRTPLEHRRLHKRVQVS